MGGFFNSDPNSDHGGGDAGMTLSAVDSGALVTVTQMDSSIVAGSPIAPAAYTAITVPEPSTLLLGALGGLALLRRRRS